jgi:peptidoglycan-N-acetylglucosamine deacetylase
VPATFFMVGSRVAEHPELARLVERRGFTIGNHTWAHTSMTSQTNAQLTHAIRETTRAFHDAGVTPTDLVRPPYGDVDDRVRRVIARTGLVPVLWTVDSRDWTGLSPTQIRSGIVAAVRPHATNVVLQHDGVTNSPATLKALPGEIATLRERGYCFAGLDAHGDPQPPVPEVSVVPDRTSVAEGGRVRLTVRLDRPTTRATTVRTIAGRVRVPAGQQVARRTWQVPQDDVDERPQDVRVGAGAVVRVLDDDPAPVVSVRDAAVVASPLLATEARVEVRLDRPRDRPLRVSVRSRLGTVEVTVPTGSRSATGTLAVPRGTPADPVRDVTMRAARSVATLTVRPPEQTWLQAARAAVERVRWPDVRVRGLF